MRGKAGNFSPQKEIQNSKIQKELFI